MPTVDEIIRYEEGEMSDDETIDLFQKLIDSGMAWKLQGFYGRTAAWLIEHGYCFPAAEVKSNARLAWTEGDGELPKEYRF